MPPMDFRALQRLGVVSLQELYALLHARLQPQVARLDAFVPVELGRGIASWVVESLDAVSGGRHDGPWDVLLRWYGRRRSCGECSLGRFPRLSRDVRVVMIVRHRLLAKHGHLLRGPEHLIICGRQWRRRRLLGRIYWVIDAMAVPIAFFRRQSGVYSWTCVH
jgi:hypothetical protein